MCIILNYIHFNHQCSLMGLFTCTFYFSAPSHFRTHSLLHRACARALHLTAATPHTRWRLSARWLVSIDAWSSPFSATAAPTASGLSTWIRRWSWRTWPKTRRRRQEFSEVLRECTPAGWSTVTVQFSVRIWEAFYFLCLLYSALNFGGIC